MTPLQAKFEVELNSSPAGSKDRTNLHWNEVEKCQVGW